MKAQTFMFFILNCLYLGGVHLRDDFAQKPSNNDMFTLICKMRDEFNITQFICSHLERTSSDTATSTPIFARSTSYTYGSRYFATTRRTISTLTLEDDSNSRINDNASSDQIQHFTDLKTTRLPEEEHVKTEGTLFPPSTKSIKAFTKSPADAYAEDLANDKHLKISEYPSSQVFQYVSTADGDFVSQERSTVSQSNVSSSAYYVRNNAVTASASNHTGNVPSTVSYLLQSVTLSDSSDKNTSGEVNSTIFRCLQVSQKITYERFKELYPVQDWIDFGYFKQSDFLKINQHWLQFRPPSAWEHYILTAIYIALCLVGMSGNLLVIFMYFRYQSLRTSANILVVNLAISDFLLEAKIPIFIFNSIYKGPALGRIGCQIYGFLGGLTGVVSIMTLTFIAFDRYYVIVFPFRHVQNSRVRFSILLSWVYGIVFASLPMSGLGFGEYVPEGLLSSCSFDYLTPDLKTKYFIFIFFTAAWVVPFCVIFYCYVKIYYTVVKSRKMEINGEVSKHCKEEENRKREVRLAYVVLSVIVLWFVSWTPYAVIALLGITGQHCLITPLSSMVPAIFCKTASCVDPFVYAVAHPRFKEELLRMFKYQKVTKVKKPKHFNHQVGSRLSSNSSFDVEEIMVSVKAKESVQNIDIEILSDPV